MTQLRQRMIEDLQLRGLSARTQEMYVRAIRQLSEHYHKSPDYITEEELRAYFLYLKNVAHYSRSASTIALCDVKFFYEHTLQRAWTTLPEELRPVARSHQHLMYNLLFRTSAAALKALAMDCQFLGGQLGLVGVLHTWTRDMAYHPHVHYLVPGGALSPPGSQWLSPRYHAWLVPVRALSKLFRGKFREALTKAALLALVPSHVWQKAWVTDCGPAGSGTAALPSPTTALKSWKTGRSPSSSRKAGATRGTTGHFTPKSSSAASSNTCCPRALSSSDTMAS